MPGSKKSTRKLRQEHFEKNPYCALCATHARQTLATDIHHSRGRGRFYLAKELFIGLCREYHEFIENNREWAKANGWMISRHVNRDESEE